MERLASIIQRSPPLVGQPADMGKETLAVAKEKEKAKETTTKPPARGRSVIKQAAKI